MSYADNTDLLLEFKGLTYGPLLASATVDEWCVQASNLIDSYLAGKYTTPVTVGASPKAHSMLKGFCIELVRQRVARVLNVLTSSNKGNQASSPGSDTQSVLATLKDLRDGKAKLEDGVLATASDGVESYTSSNQATTRPQFTRNGEDW